MHQSFCTIFSPINFTNFHQAELVKQQQWRKLQLLEVIIYFHKSNFLKYYEEHDMLKNKSQQLIVIVNMS